MQNEISENLIDLHESLISRMGCNESISAATVRKGLSWEKMAMDSSQCGRRGLSSLLLSLSHTVFRAASQFGALNQCGFTFFFFFAPNLEQQMQRSLIKKMLYSFLGGYLKDRIRSVLFVQSCWSCKMSPSSPSPLRLTYLCVLSLATASCHGQRNCLSGKKNSLFHSFFLCFVCQTSVGQSVSKVTPCCFLCTVIKYSTGCQSIDCSIIQC